MQILLAYTTTSTPARKSGAFESLLPIGLCSLHALLRSRNIPVNLANLSGLPDRTITTLLRQLKPTIVGLSQWTHNRHATIRLAGLVKQTLPGCLVMLGGGHATHQADLILQQHPEVDLIIPGEAEQTLLKLLEAISNGTELHNIPGLVLRQNGQIRHTGLQPAWKELDLLPFPASYLREALYTDAQTQAEFISSSRGCPAACNFCASPSFWGRRIRYRSAASVAQEMRFIREQFGLIYLSLRDDTFTADRRRTIAFCKELIEQRVNVFWNCQSRVEAIDQETLGWMRRAGCECIQLGVESGSPTILKQLGKRITPEQVVKAADLIHAAGLQLSIFLITAIPEETDKDRLQTIELTRRIRPDDLQVAPLAYYPGTALYDDAVAQGTLAADLFETNGDEAVLACKDGPSQVDRLLTRLGRFKHRGSARLLETLQQHDGYSAVTAMQLGDLYLAEGRLQLAEEQYCSITTREPDHPWGWYLRGELYEQSGSKRDAVACYQRVKELVPFHAPSLEGLKRLGHKKSG